VTAHRPPFPVGWFAVAALADLPVGALVPLAAFGQDLAVGRTTDGRTLVTHSLCPHLGANLAAGGHIDEDRVVCPQHGWCFGHDGACTWSAGEPAPDTVRLRVWPTVVAAGTVLAYHGRDGEIPSTGPPPVAMEGVVRVQSRQDHPEDMLVGLLRAAGVAEGEADGDSWSATAGDGNPIVVHGPGTVEHRDEGGGASVVYVTPVNGFSVAVRSAGLDPPPTVGDGDLPGFRDWYRRFDRSSAPRTRPARSGRRARSREA